MRYRSYTTIGGIAIAVVAGLYALEREIGDGLVSCGNEPIRTENSPDGALRAVLFERDCGATTGISTQVSILTKNESLPNESGNAFIIGHNPAVSLTWIQARALKLSYKPTQTVFLKKAAVNGVSIHYATEQ